MIDLWLVSRLELLRITMLFPVMHSWVLFSIVAIYLKLLNQFLSKGTWICESKAATLLIVYNGSINLGAAWQRYCAPGMRKRKPRDGEINKVDAREEVN